MLIASQCRLKEEKNELPSVQGRNKAKEERSPHDASDDMHCDLFSRFSMLFQDNMNGYQMSVNYRTFGIWVVFSDGVVMIPGQ